VFFGKVMPLTAAVLPEKAGIQSRSLGTNGLVALVSWLARADEVIE
jgi:hypothetical protein